MNHTLSFVGIDVSKAELDVYVRPSGTSWTVPNNAEGYAQLVCRLNTIAPTLIVLEATGGLEHKATYALAEAALPVVCVATAGRRRRDGGRPDKKGFIQVKDVRIGDPLVVVDITRIEAGGAAAIHGARAAGIEIIGQLNHIRDVDGPVSIHISPDKHQ